MVRTVTRADSGARGSLKMALEGEEEEKLTVRGPLSPIAPISTDDASSIANKTVSVET